MSGGPPDPPSLEERYAEIAKKTTEAIQAEEQAPANNNPTPQVQPNLPSLPKYEPPKPRRMEPRERICRMFFPSSGHQGFDLVKDSSELPPLDVVQQMILYETRLRLCDSIQQIMDEYHEDEAAVT